MQVKLNEKIQDNFRAELQTIRKHSHRSISRNSGVMRSVSGGRSDGNGTQNVGTLMSGTMITEDISNMDFTEAELIEQTRKADQKILLLQKQI